MNIDRTFPEVFQENVRKYPDKVALVDQDGARGTCYAELDLLSSKVCALLLKKGVHKGDMIPVCLPRCMEYIAAEIGVLKAGAAFIALAKDYPKARIDFICQDCHAALVIDEAFMEEAMKETPADSVPVTVEDRAFAIYTSGSTGNPKGIMHTHKSMSASIMRYEAIYDATENDVQLCCSPLGFIVMVGDIYTPLALGYTVHILPEEKRRDVRAVEKYVLDHKITLTFISPQMLRLFDQSYDNTPIGKAAPGIRTLLLDENGKEAGPGGEGELCIIGHIAHEYINLPEQTSKAFVMQPDGTFLFHTNDICRMLPDGNLVYVDRKDWMVKVNGQRVELGEIEVVMRDIPQIGAAPTNEKEEAVCAAFGKVLRLNQVGITEDFFGIGGDSIQAIMLTTELNGLAVDDVYEHKTPQKIAQVWTGEEPASINGVDDEKFKNLFDEQGRMRILAGMRYYKKTADENNMPRFAFVFKEPIDAECLEYAVKKAFPRFKVHCMKVTGDENRLYLELNDRPPVLQKNDGTRPVAGNKANNGYLTRVGYSGNEITVDVFHGINDGVGTQPFLQTLAYYYCEKKYGTKSEDIPGLILAETPEDPRECADCMLFLPEEDVKPEGKYVCKQAFTFPDEQMESPWACKHYLLKVDASTADSYIRSNGSSTAAFFSLFMNRVIAKKNDLKGLPVVGAMAVNARPAYHAEATMQCCVGTIPVYYDEEIAALSLQEQLVRTKQIVRQQMKPQNIISAAQGTKRFNERMEQDYPLLEEKMKFCQEINARSGSLYTYGISTVGEYKLGKGIDEHIAELHAQLPANTIPVILEILKFNGEYYVTYMTHLENDPYVYALKDLFLAEGIPCTCEYKGIFEECIAEFEI